MTPGRFDGGLSDRERSLAFLHHEDFLVGMLVQLRTASRWSVDQRERKVDVPVPVSLELMGGPVEREFLTRNESIHQGLILSSRIPLCGPIHGSLRAGGGARWTSCSSPTMPWLTLQKRHNPPSR